MCIFDTAVAAGYSRYKTTVGFFSVKIPTTHNKQIPKKSQHNCILGVLSIGLS
jgi:hypothetical protein